MENSPAENDDNVYEWENKKHDADTPEDVGRVYRGNRRDGESQAVHKLPRLLVAFHVRHHRSSRFRSRM
jgi:hypothetical protein